MKNPCTLRRPMAIKNLRAGLKAGVERFLSKDCVVILDSMNYIKGYRYELYCIARAQRTPNCVIWFDVPLDTALEWNEGRGEKRLDPVLLKDLASRFEAPIEKNRWDAPLFRLEQDQELPLDRINEALFERHQKPPNIATLPQVISDTNFVYELDKTTQEIIAAILQAQTHAMLGDCIPCRVTSCSFFVVGFLDLAAHVRLVKKFNLAELRRMQRQFLKISQMHPPRVEHIGDTFVEYLNTSLA
ncbi:Chromatin associated protein [Acanthamoeba castellanii str. Neff]|uniref:Chromatin associated protein n=1 Tax=Acanthamoeba castellanii (strain ATCC 30010 / Neff) TaxID=1257118 RepID=L8GUQ1_ACACF|nr:Chromatin associated protein [Acanthamoeba castellanii str. Neff]ELR16725.1 Chromatin associated protein [Acanthamoeba castellanii str. Neff]